MSFWKPNISGAGRILRITGGILLLAGAWILNRQGIAIWPWVLGTGGVFMLFEGMRGWCVLRACKIKTPL